MTWIQSILYVLLTHSGSLTSKEIYKIIQDKQFKIQTKSAYSIIPIIINYHLKKKTSYSHFIKVQRNKINHYSFRFSTTLQGGKYNIDLLLLPLSILFDHCDVALEVYVKSRLKLDFGFPNVILSLGSCP